MAVVIKTLKTPGGHYVYDRETNSHLYVTEEEFVACQQVEKEEAQVADLQVLKRYVSQGYFAESRLRKITHPDAPHMTHLLETRMAQLVIQVGQSCNLRCHYCVYGGNYDNQRTHSDKAMSLDTINLNSRRFYNYPQGYL